MQNIWEIFFQDWVRHHKMLHVSPRAHFRNNPDYQQNHRRDEQQAPRQNQTQKHNSPMMPSSCLGVRRLLAYGKHRWPLRYS